MENQPAPREGVWAAMAYTPPRGRCQHRTALISACPCLRFMLHPIKAATSFECDGCGHHASFHSMENEAEEAILKKWAEQSRILSGGDGVIPQPNKKRRRITAKPEKDVEVLDITEELSDSASTTTQSRGSLLRASTASSRRRT